MNDLVQNEKICVSSNMKLSLSKRVWFKFIISSIVVVPVALFSLVFLLRMVGIESIIYNRAMAEYGAAVPLCNSIRIEHYIIGIRVSGNQLACVNYLLVVPIAIGWYFIIRKSNK